MTEDVKLGVFDIVSAIGDSKRDYFRGETSDLAEKTYVPFLINKALSFHIDTILYANEMNQRGHLDNLLQHDYLINTVRSRRRRSSKWPKPSDDNDIKAVMEYYACNYNRARDFLTVLTKDQLAVIHDRTKKGGADDRHSRDGRSKTEES